MARKRAATTERLANWWDEAALELGLSEQKDPPTITLSEFVQQSWEVLEPSTNLDWNWHLDVVCDHVQAVLFDWLAKQSNPEHNQRAQNLLVNIPPGSMKSRIVAVCMPAWF